MIPLNKLEKLPRSQRLRKAGKVAGEAEQRYALSGKLESREAEYFAGLMELLAGDEGFAPPAVLALKTAQSNFRVCAAPGAKEDTETIRRTFNTVRHLLLAETGIFPSDWDFTGQGAALDPLARRPFPGMRVYLEDIRSPFNVGAMFRAAESFGGEKIWLSPLCADPRHKRAARTAMGCVDALPWERLSFEPFAEAREKLPRTDFSVGPFFALETGGIPLADFPFPASGIMIAGSEELGVSPPALAAADASLGRVTIPTWGAKGSLNVSVAFGIVMQAWASSLTEINFVRNNSF